MNKVQREERRKKERKTMRQMGANSLGWVLRKAAIKQQVLKREDGQKRVSALRKAKAVKLRKTETTKLRREQKN